MRLHTLQIMPDDGQAVKDGWNVARQRDFRGGETQALLPELVSRNQLLVMENILLFTTGYLSSFFQLSEQLITRADPGVCLSLSYGGVYNTFYAPGNNKVIVSFIDTASAAAKDISTGINHSVTGAYISGLVKPVMFLAKLYCSNPNPDTSLNGILNLTDYTLITNPGKTIKKLAVYTNRLWAVNSNGTIQISNNGDATTWDPMNILWLPNQEPALDFVPVQGGAIVYGANSVYAMYGADYTDITFVPLQLGKHFTAGNVEVNGIVYIMSTEGIYKTTLNGADLLPHNQHDFFQSIFPVLIASPGSIKAVHLQKFSAIIYTWSAALGGSRSIIYYYHNNSYSKGNILLPAACPYAMNLDDINTDFLFGLSTGTYVKSGYPSVNQQQPSISILQTRYEDADSPRLKTWGELGITVQTVTFGVTIEAIIDYAGTSIIVASNALLTIGSNIFNLNNSEGLATGTNFPETSEISFRITFDSDATITTNLSSETNSQLLISETTGNYLTFDSMPRNFIVQELRLKYCLSGLDV